MYPKLVTGVIIDSAGNPAIKNSLREKIIKEHKYLIGHPDDNESRQRLKGLLTAARLVSKQSFQSIYRFAYSENKEIIAERVSK